MINPIVPEPVGDPFILTVGNHYYMSASGGGPKTDSQFVMWHSTDLQHWSKPTVILDFEDVSWAYEKAWAPSMVEHNGYYYLAFCADQQIGIAVCDSPMGMYRDILGRPLIAKEDHPDFQVIDPAFLKDDDGKIYLAYGQGKCLMSEISLTPDSAEFVGETVCLSDELYYQKSIDVHTVDKSLYNEAPDLIKIGDRYLFSWAIYDVRDYRYGVRYAWADNPMGPYVMPIDFDHDNILLQGRHDITGCGHACIVRYDDAYWIVYGRHPKHRLGGYGRDLCCEKIDFLDDWHLSATPTALTRTFD